MTRKGYHTIVITTKFYEMAIRQANREKRSISNQLEADIEACN